MPLANFFETLRDGTKKGSELRKAKEKRSVRRRMKTPLRPTRSSSKIAEIFNGRHLEIACSSIVDAKDSRNGQRRDSHHEQVRLESCNQFLQ